MATGFVGIYSFELLFPESHSLKEKRMHLRSVKAQLTNRVACSIAEVDHHDVWQRSRLTLACVAREAGDADGSSTPPNGGSSARISSCSPTSVSWCRSMTRDTTRSPRMRRVDEAIKAVVSETIPRSRIRGSASSP